ncbi:unnamed protein product [Cyclocybe aegerita]|uniref:Potassium channel domain-containing protein n=1 Tax=Cyclocybe aegerita TaxID=1973307 RepID=A0A8S0XUH9_CYCAE|nr:unnamed protein product [Cyclocybe aegerita]
MNDPGLEVSIQVSEDTIQRRAPPKRQVRRKEAPPHLDELGEHGRDPLEAATPSVTKKPHKIHHSHPRRRRQIYEDEEESSIYQPTHWWVASTTFPLIAGTFGPIANLFSVCALAQSWRIRILDGSRVPDPPWLIACNTCSLAFALIANIVLLFNFARRIPYSRAQPITISLWYLSCILLIVPIGLTHDSDIYIEAPSIMTHSQAYYYGLISGILYFTISTLLLLSTIGAVIFKAYPASFSTLTPAQRTLMLQTVSFSLYLALGAGIIFSSIEDWGFADGVYWADYTLLTIGLGTDFPLTTTLGRMLLIPYAAFGITLVGLVVSSVRGLMLERAKAKVARRHLGKEREKWKENIRERRQLADIAASTMVSTLPRSVLQDQRERLHNRRLMKLPQQLSKHVSEPLKPEDQYGPWHRAEFELMRFIEAHAESAERYIALGASFLVILIVWFVGSVIFWVCEHRTQGWTYPESIYFTYTTLLTIGYGDFYPNSPAGKPFFVVWSLISVPAMTVLISNMGDTVVKWVQDATLWASRWTILPEWTGPKGQEKRMDRSKAHRIDGRGNPSLDQVPESAASTAVGDPTDKTTSHMHTTETLQRFPPKKHRKHRHEPNDARRPNNNNMDILEHDVEKLGGAVARFEEGEGRSSSLAAQISREISHLAKDLRANPPRKYSWEEWERWLHMLGEREGAVGRVAEGENEEERERRERLSPVPILNSTPNERLPSPTTANSHAPTLIPPSANGDASVAKAKQSSVVQAADDAEHGTDWHWTWLGDHGPLFSRLTETEWLIEKFCFRLEEVLEDEIKEARRGNKAKS